MLALASRPFLNAFRLFGLEFDRERDAEPTESLTAIAEQFGVGFRDFREGWQELQCTKDLVVKARLQAGVGKLVNIADLDASSVWASVMETCDCTPELIAAVKATKREGEYFLLCERTNTSVERDRSLKKTLGGMSHGMLGPEFLDQRMRCKAMGPDAEKVAQMLADEALVHNGLIARASVDYIVQGKYRQTERQDPKGTEREKLSEEQKPKLKTSAKKVKTSHNVEGPGEVCALDKLGEDAGESATAEEEMTTKAASMTMDTLLGNMFAAEAGANASEGAEPLAAKMPGAKGKFSMKVAEKSKKKAGPIATMGFSSMEIPTGRGRGRGRGRGKKGHLA